MRGNEDMDNRIRLKCLWSALAVLIIILIIALIVTNKGDDKNAKGESESQEMSSEEESTTEEVTEPELVALSTEDEVYGLIVSYIDATYKNADITLLEEIMDSVENIDVQAYEVYQRYIASFENIQCYMLEGKDDINVVFVTYMIKLNNYDTMLPGAESIKVKKDGEGVYKIHNAEVGETIQDYITNEEEAKALDILKKKIQSEYNAVIESNSELKSIVDIMNGAKNQ